VLRCIDWLQAQGLEVNQELWDGLYHEAQFAKRGTVRLRARAMILDRIDPAPRDIPPQLVSAPPLTLNLGVQLVNTAGKGEETKSARLTLNLGDNGH